MGLPQSVQVTSSPGITAPEGQPTMTNCHLLWMWDTECGQLCTDGTDWQGPVWGR